MALSEELADVLAVRLLGEDLVLFRDLGGRLGLLHRHCSHRGASLEFGMPTTRGLRCCYHGWLYDIDGTILETPAEPESSRLRFGFCHGAYPTHERAGLIFAYLGPPSERPEFPVYDSWVHPEGNELRPYKLSYACNWLQCHENAADPIHIPFLHGRVSGARFSPGFSELPVVLFKDTPLGMVTASVRHADGRLWIRTADVILPNVAQYPIAFETGESERQVLGAWGTRWIVPIDDTHSWAIGFRHFNPTIDPLGQGKRSEVGLEKVDFPGQARAPEAVRQANPGDYEAMVGQGAIAIHANEHLASSDRGVIRFRELLGKAIADVRDGQVPTSPRRNARGTVPTYTYEATLPWPAAPAPATLRAIGGRVLGALLESAFMPLEERARTTSVCLEEASCK